MGPKKKKAGKKKASRGKSKEAEDTSLPPVPRPHVITPSDQSLFYNVGGGVEGARTVARMVQHYNFGSALKEIDVNGATPLHHAVAKGDLEMVRLLLSYGNAIDIDATEKEVVGGYSALHRACLKGNDRIVRMLCESGAAMNLKAKSSLGETPLHICCKTGDRYCAKALIACGVKKDTLDAMGHNASFWAQRHNPDMIKELNLPPVHTSTAEDFLKIMIARNPFFKAPSASSGGKKAKKGSGGKKKKK